MSALPARPLSPIDHKWVIKMTSVILILGILAAYAVLATAAVASNFFFYDALGYWETGMRLRSGGELYPPVADQDHPSVYRYAPWFAWIWVGLTYLPLEVVLLGWGLLLAAASAWLLLQLPKSITGLALALVFGPLLFRVVSQGNVQPLLVAAIAWGIARRSGPILIAFSASLKLVPLLFVAVYVARREYLRAGTAVAATVLLWLPAVAYGMEHYPTTVGGEAFPFGSSTFVVAAAAALAVFFLPNRYRLLAAAVAASFANPRWIPYNPSYLLASTRDPRSDR